MKLLFVTVVDHAFCSHRLNLALAARDAGYEIVVVAEGTGAGAIIEENGMRFIPVPFSRASLNPIHALRTILRLATIYRREQPDLLHHIAIKPVLFGSIAAKLAGIRGVVNLIGGRGWLFTSTTPAASLVRPVIRVFFRLFLQDYRLVVQNRDDAVLMRSIGLRNVAIVPGSGVDPVRFAPSLRSNGTTVIVLVARMLWDKGVGDFVEAARILIRRGANARFILVGPLDPGSRSSISAEQLKTWERDGVIEFRGFTDDVPAVLATADIACLPSYSEGIPKSMLEAGAAGLPLVATDVPGCREVVVEGENGFLVPVRDPNELANALGMLIAAPDLRRRMGERSRALVVERFTTDHVIAATLAIYEQASPSPAAGMRHDRHGTGVSLN